MRGTMIATGPAAASAASSATRPSPSPASTASTIWRWTSRRRSTSEAGGAAALPPAPPVPGLPEPCAPGSARALMSLRGRCRRVRMGLQPLLPGLAGADAVGRLDRHDEHLAIADRARAGVLEDRVHDRLHVLISDNALDLDLRPEVVRHRRTAVVLGDPLLPPRPLDLGDRQRREPQLEQLRADRFERLVPRIGDHHLHAGTSLVVGANPGDPAGPLPAGPTPMSSGAGMNCSG